MSGTDNGAAGNISDTGQGVLVGTQPAQPRLAADWGGTPRPDQAVTQPQVVIGQPAQVATPGYSQADIDRALAAQRQHYDDQMGQMSNQLAQIQSDRAAEIAERDRLAAEAAEATRLREEGEMEVRDLLTKKEQEWQGRLEEMDRRYAADRAVFEQERRLREVQDYRQARVEQEGEFILPELREFVAGNTPEEVDASIEAMKARSESIFNNILAQAQPQVLRPAAMPSVPPVGPMEQLPSYETLSPQDIAGMDMDTYKRYREGLLRAASQQRRGQ
jgi:hypothetical protein